MQNFYRHKLYATRISARPVWMRWLPPSGSTPIWSCSMSRAQMNTNKRRGAAQMHSTPSFTYSAFLHLPQLSGQNLLSYMTDGLFQLDFFSSPKRFVPGIRSRMAGRTPGVSPHRLSRSAPFQCHLSADDLWRRCEGRSGNHRTRYGGYAGEHLCAYPAVLWSLGKSLKKYHNADRRRTIGKITAAMPGMDGDMWTLAQQTLSKLKRMTDSDYDSQKFYFTDENE